MSPLRQDFGQRSGAFLEKAFQKHTCAELKVAATPEPRHSDVPPVERQDKAPLLSGAPPAGCVSAWNPIVQNNRIHLLAEAAPGDGVRV